ncbi:MAG: ABC transporter permease [Bifidobacteriaceae bacterium]|nr:ABC transporter permease [Bifidobacteriaceae bacterium]
MSAAAKAKTPAEGQAQSQATTSGTNVAPTNPNPKPRWHFGHPHLAGGRGLNWFCVSLFGVITLVAVLAQHLAQYDPVQPAGKAKLPIGSADHLLGTDHIGRDLLSRIIIGLQTSWLVALAIVALSLVAGTVVGVIAGTVGGWVDKVLMRFTEVFQSLPTLLVAMAVAMALGHGIKNTMIAILVVWWPYYARIIRGEVRAIASRPHVEAARQAGASWPRVMLFHIIPGMVPTAIITASLDVGSTVLTLATLSFMGLGREVPFPELGADSANTLDQLSTAWWIPVLPGMAVMVLTLVANLTGDAVRRLLAGRR